MMLRRVWSQVLVWLLTGCATVTVGSAQSIQVSAPIAFLLDVGTDGMLFDKKGDEPHPPASLVKLLTAETVFQALKDGAITLDRELPITEGVWRRGGAPAGSAAMFAPLNSRVSVSNLLQGLVVQSANDAALALAEGIAGNEAAFVARMQERAKAIGLTRSQFRNATGYAHAEQRVTARDMARLARHVVEAHPDHMPIFSQREFTWNSIRQTNRNPLIAMNIGAEGFATGFLTEGGYNLVGGAKQDDRRLIAVVMGADSAASRAADARKLIEWGFANFEKRRFLDGRAMLIEATVSGGTAPVVPLGLKEDVDLLMPKSPQDVVSASIVYRSPVRAPIAAGAEIGRLVVRRGPAVALDVPVVALEEVPQGSLAKRAWDNTLDWLAGIVRRSPK